MMYNVEHKSDLANGTSIYVKVPENQVDYKALYTAQKFPPDFLLPFHYRNVDGQVEFVYKIESLDTFESLCGTYSPKEYAELWYALLYPLPDCGEWFLKPYSFVLNAEKLFRDTEKPAIRYMYIPSLQDCSSFSALKDMVTAFASRVSTHDLELEVMVLRAVMNDFNPKTLVQMLKPYICGSLGALELAQKEIPDTGIAAPQINTPPHTPSQQFSDEKNSNYETHSTDTEITDEIFINLPEETAASKKKNKPKKQKETLMDMGIPNQKTQKRTAKNQKPKSDSFFQRLRNRGKDIIIE